ncbi:protein kinase domain-containing protein [Planctomicrobium sp. SH527]|uniref:protein kinase domain-containing protein n=1 Tax=Planctomicrobium sp. SH527 TaxID=3448123 RepID=UPI003F5B2C6F
MSESQIQSLVDNWFDQRELGGDISITELCQEYPELAEEIQRRVAVILQFDQLINQNDIASMHNTVCFSDQNDSTPADGRAVLKLPTRLGDFTLLKVLGEGGMGTVYLAEDGKLGRKVAIKVIGNHLAATASARARFLREARAMAAVEHKHVMTIYAVGEENRTPFLVMPVLKGESLDSRLRRELRLPAGEACRIAQEIAEGLDAAHKLGLIHRDIKPSNIWLEGPRAKVTILDFGLARSINQDDGHGVTINGAVMGTPAYMPPEQAAGMPANVRSDLFSLGVLLYRMVTGIQPFAGESMIATLNKLANYNPPSPSQDNPEIPAPLSDLILRLISKTPSERPASAEEVSAELAQFTNFTSHIASPAPYQNSSGDSLPTTPLASQPARHKPPSNGRRLAIGFGGAAAALLLGVIVITLQKKDGSQTKIEIPSDVRQVEIQPDGENMGRIVVERKDEASASQMPPADLAMKARATPSSSGTSSPMILPLAETGHYAELDGKTSWIETPLIDDGSGPLTFEMWVWAVPLQFHSSCEFFFHNETTVVETNMNFPVIRVSPSASGADGTLTRSQTRLPSHRFAHLAAVIDDQLENRLYIDGQLVAAVTRADVREPAQKPWIIGAAAWHGSETLLQGGVDEIHIRRGAHYSSDFVPSRHKTPDQSTIALYHLDETSGEKLVDSSANGHHGRLVSGLRRPERTPLQVQFPPPQREYNIPANIPNGLTAMAWTPDSEKLYFAGWNRVFTADRAQDGFKEFDLDMTGLFQIAYLNNESIVVGTEYGTIAKVQFNQSDKELIQWRLAREGQKVTHLSISKDGSHTVALFQNQSDPKQSTVLILDTNTGDIQREWKPVTGAVEAVVILPDDTLYIASYEGPTSENANNGKVILVNQTLVSGDLIRTASIDAEPHENIKRMQLTSRGRHISAATSGHSLRLIDPREDKFIGRVQVAYNARESSATDDGRLWFTSDGMGTSLFDMNAMKRLHYLPGYHGQIAISPDEQWIALLEGQRMKIWEMKQFLHSDTTDSNKIKVEID